jgi:hypothetical protein
MVEEPSINESCLKNANDFINRHPAVFESSVSKMASKEVLIGNLATEVYDACVKPSSTPNSAVNTEKSR